MDFATTDEVLLCSNVPPPPLVHSTAILLNRWILPVRGVALEKGLCAASKSGLFI